MWIKSLRTRTTIEIVHFLPTFWFESIKSHCIIVTTVIIIIIIIIIIVLLRICVELFKENTKRESENHD